MTVHARRLLIATFDTQVLWQSAMYEQFGPGGWITRECPEFNREHLLFAWSIGKHVNNKTGTMYPGLNGISQALGYSGNNHPGSETVGMATAMGWFTDTGKKMQRAKVLALSAPVDVLELYQNLAESATGELITTMNLAVNTPAGVTN